MNNISSLLKFIAEQLMTSKGANKVLAAPNGADGQPTYRALVAADIPSLAASKTTSGTFDAARIPSLATSKITSGTFDAARIPTLDIGSKTSGTLAIGRGGTGQTGTNTPSISISTTHGTISSATVKQFGKVVQLTVDVKKSSTTGAGNDIWEGTINTTALRPAVAARGCGYLSDRPIMFAIGTNGSCQVRNCGGSTIAANTGVTVSATYIIP